MYHHSSREGPDLPCSCCFLEGELEAEWLQDVGLSTLISGNEEEDGKALVYTDQDPSSCSEKEIQHVYPDSEEEE